MDNFPEPTQRPQYRWPKYLLAFVLLGIVLAIVWVSAAARRVSRQRDPDYRPFPALATPAPTNGSGSATNPAAQ